jgi:hypothetical protein
MLPAMRPLCGRSANSLPRRLPLVPQVAVARPSPLLLRLQRSHPVESANRQWRLGPHVQSGHRVAPTPLRSPRSSAKQGPISFVRQSSAPNCRAKRIHLWHSPLSVMPSVSWRLGERLSGRPTVRAGVTLAQVPDRLSVQEPLDRDSFPADRSNGSGGKQRLA